MARADELFAAEDYANALAAYQSATGIKPEESRPQEQITIINQTLDAIAAQEALDKQYAETIENAEQLLVTGEYEQAMSAYMAASDLKPSEEYPRQKINEVVQIQEELARQAEIDRQYESAVSFADKHFDAGDYDNAIREYKVANGLKPDEPYPIQKLAEIEGILIEQQRQKEIEANYNAAIVKAEDLLEEEDFNQAIIAYQEALEIKPEDAFASAKLAETRQSLAAFEAKKDEMYNQAITNAENYFTEGDFEMARLEYERASEIKPDETYPVDQLKKVNEELLRQRQIIQEAYDKAIADADKFYAGKIYDEAIESYRTAAELKPTEDYPKEMSKRILKLISERAIVQINKDPILIKDNTTKKFEFLPVSVKDRRSNYIYFKATSRTADNYKVIISFGQDQSKNGGMVIRIPRNIGPSDFIVRISAQYKWFSEDNNWLTFYPEGGDIEVSLVQISYSD
jgi:tetratricopeptide (TPR) repeat protein